jgi:hypothetical protein
MDAFTKAYLECALWSSTDDDGDPLDRTYRLDDFAPETLRQAIEDCTAFQADNASDLEGVDIVQAGRDFWLTRNGHGCGFWDRGLGEVGLRLTDAAHVYGSVDLYVGDDHLIWG